MKLFQKTWVALVVTAVVVLLSTSVNVNANLDKKAEAAKALWTAKYGPAEQLSVQQSNASQLWSVTRNYGALQPQNDALRVAYNALYEALDKADVTGAYEASTALTAAAHAAYASLQSQADASARDLENAAYYCNLIENAQRVLDPTAYNAAVAEYQRLISAFPLSLLRPLFRTETPAYFGDA